MYAPVTCQLLILSRRCSADCPGAADIVIALDVSGSIRQERFADILEYFVGVVENLEVYNDKVRVGALTFSDSATLQFRLNERSTRQDVIQVRRDVASGTLDQRMYIYRARQPNALPFWYCSQSVGWLEGFAIMEMVLPNGAIQLVGWFTY